MWAVIKKEFKSYFCTPIGYVFIGVFLIAFSISFYFSVIGYGNVNFENIFYSLPILRISLLITDKLPSYRILYFYLLIAYYGCLSG